MQKNRSIALIDISDFNNHFIETLLFTSIFEKQYDQLTMLDLNSVGHNQYIDKAERGKNTADLSTFKVFDRSLYQILQNSSQKQNKALNLIDTAINKNQNLLISLSQSENGLNNLVLDKIAELVIFADIKKNITNNLLNFVVNSNIKDKQITLVIYNYVPNSINNEKELLSIRKMTKGFNLSIVTIDKMPVFKSLDDITHVDPWNDLYKVIKKII